MNRNFRLTQSSEFKRVRHSGKSYAHPLIVLIVAPAADGKTQFGIVAGRSVGNAVRRNRAKRLAREALRLLIYRIDPGWKIILIARTPILSAQFSEIKDCLLQLFIRARLVNESNEP